MARLKSDTDVDKIYWEADIKESGEKITMQVVCVSNLPKHEQEFFNRYTVAFINKKGAGRFEAPSKDYPENVIAVAEFWSLEQLVKAENVLFELNDNLFKFSEAVFKAYQRS